MTFYGFMVSVWVSALVERENLYYFSPNTPNHVRESVKQTLEIPVEVFSERYLGLPIAAGRITSGTFDHIHERIRSITQGIERMLSCVG